MLSPNDTRLPERFRVKFVVNPDTGCWEWIAQRSTGGYARFKDSRDQYAHRYAYERLIGSIPAHLQSDHLCRVRHCVNPSHMELVTSRENTLRGDSVPGMNSRKTHCLRRHPFDEVNTQYRQEKRGGRACRACRRAHDKRVRVAQGVA